MLKVKKSKILGAGQGLFTTTFIKKGDLIVEYKGQKTTWKQICRKYGKDGQKALYSYFISSKNCIDAQNNLEALARYVNDVNGPSKTKFKNNAEFVNIRGKAYIRAITKIKPNNEIFVDYGDDYWKNI